MIRAVSYGTQAERIAANIAKLSALLTREE
jgi:hypothetical protein